MFFVMLGKKNFTYLLICRGRVKGGEMTVEDLNLLDGCWQLHFKYGGFMVGVKLQFLIE